MTETKKGVIIDVMKVRKKRTLSVRIQDSKQARNVFRCIYKTIGCLHVILKNEML